MGILPDKLRIWVVARDISVRARLREALMNVLFKPVIRVFSTPKELTEPSSSSDGPQMVIVTLSFGQEEIVRLASLVKVGPEAQQPKVVVALDGRGNLASSGVVAMYLDGIDGFVSEPYSIRDIQLLFNSLLGHHDAHATIDRTHRSAVFVFHDSMQYIDQIAARLSSAEQAPVHARRELMQIHETLRKLHEKNPTEFESALLEAFHDLPVPKSSDGQAHRKLSKPRLAHPGRVVKELTVERGLSAADLARLMRVPPEDVQALLDEKAPITDSLSNALARGLGRSPRDWLTLQREYDKQQNAQKK